MLRAFIEACTWLRAHCIEVNPILKDNKGAANTAGNFGDVSSKLVTDHISEGIGNPPRAQKVQKMKLFVSTRLI